MAASPAAQQAFDLQLIEAVRNPREQVQDENELTQAVDKLLKRGVDVNAADDYGYTALMIAAKNDHTEVVAELLARRADVDLARSDGYTALMIASRNGHAETVSALLSHDGVDWQIVQNQLSHPELRNLNKEVLAILAFILPGGSRNSIITSFNQRNPNERNTTRKLGWSLDV